MSTSYTLEHESGYEDDELVIEDKGWYDGLTILVGAMRYKPTFYNPSCFKVMCEGQLALYPAEVAPNAVFVRSVTRANIEAAVEYLASIGFRGLTPEPQ